MRSKKDMYEIQEGHVSKLGVGKTNKHTWLCEDQRFL